LVGDNMLEFPKVSIVLPTYNRANLIGRSIQSLLNQTFKDCEIIVVDDFSSDNTEEIVKKIDDPCIHYFRHKANLGAAAARNTGITLSKGEFITFQDSDDEWIKDKLEKQINKFQSLAEMVDLVYSGFSFVSETSGENISEFVPALKGNVYVNFLKGCILGSPTPIVRKECFQESGFFDESLPSCQDWDMWIRISKYYEFDYVRDNLAKYYVHGEQISTNLDDRITGLEKILDKHYDDISENNEAFSLITRKLGLLFALSGNPKKARKFILMSIYINPFQRITIYFHFLLSFLMPKFQKKLFRNVALVF
jgi:glycosyltransferase involved in cell wall biosynthesis